MLKIVPSKFPHSFSGSLFYFNVCLAIIHDHINKLLFLIFFLFFSVLQAHWLEENFAKVIDTIGMQRVEAQIKIFQLAVGQSQECF